MDIVYVYGYVWMYMDVYGYLELVCSVESLEELKNFKVLMANIPFSLYQEKYQLNNTFSLMF